MNWDVAIGAFSMAWWTACYYLVDAGTEGTTSYVFVFTYRARRTFGFGPWESFVAGVRAACGYDV